MPTTSNFGWTTPADTDLVKDGAAAIRTLGNGIDTSLVDLKGGTTGQILSKASNTDLDYTWITNDVGDITNVAVTAPITGGGSSGSVTIGIQDGTTAQKGAVQLENSTSSTSTTTAAVPASVKSAYDLANAAIPKSLVDAAGDLIYATANDTVARLAIGTAGKVLTVNSGATAPEWATLAAGGMTLINAGGTTLSGASTDITSIPSTYYDLIVYIVNPYAATADAPFYWFNTDTTASNYNTLLQKSSNSGSASWTADNNARLSPAYVGTGSTDYNFISLRIPNYATTGSYKLMEIFGRQKNESGTFFLYNGVAEWRNTAAISTLKLRLESGNNWSGGTVFVYGVK